jgi:hypothetical protein
VGAACGLEGEARPRQLFPTKREHPARGELLGCAVTFTEEAEQEFVELMWALEARHVRRSGHGDLARTGDPRGEPIRDFLYIEDVFASHDNERRDANGYVAAANWRRVVGWSIDSSPTAGLVTNALGMAINSRNPKPGISGRPRPANISARLR